MIQHEGKYILNELSLSTPRCKKLDVTPYAVKCDIYENILASTVVAELTLSDSTGILDAFNLSEETFTISFTTHESANPVEYKLKVVEVSPIKSIPNNKAVVFTLTCISEEMVKSKTIKNIPLVRKEIESENVVKALLDLLETDKNFFAEKTKGVHTFSLTNINPFASIDQVRRGAISEKYNGSAFVFYENNRGYHFKSIEGLIDEGKKAVGDKCFTYSTLADVDSTASKWRNIIAHKTIQNGNHNVALATGGYNNVSKRYNLETGELESYEKKATNVDFISLNEKSITSSLKQQQKRSKDEGKLSFSFYSPDQENNQLIEKNNYLPYYLTQFLTIISHITIYGDSTITVGDVIDCHFPNTDGLTLGDDRAYVEDSSIFSGRYLVCKARHVLTFGEMAEYYQGLEIIKDGFGGTM